MREIQQHYPSEKSTGLHQRDASSSGGSARSRCARVNKSTSIPCFLRARDRVFFSAEAVAENAECFSDAFRDGVLAFDNEITHLIPSTCEEWPVCYRRNLVTQTAYTTTSDSQPPRSRSTHEGQSYRCACRRCSLAPHLLMPERLSPR